MHEINVENKLVVFEYYSIGWHQSGPKPVTYLATSITNYFCSAHFSLGSPKLLDGYGIQFFDAALNSFVKTIASFPLKVIELAKCLFPPFQFHRVVAGFDHHFTTQNFLQEFLSVCFEFRTVYIYSYVGIFSPEEKWRHHFGTFFASPVESVSFEGEFFAVVRFMDFILSGVRFSLKWPFHTSELGQRRFA